MSRFFPLALLCATLTFAQTRPRIEGFSHVGFRVANLEKTRQFYASAMGFEEAFHQQNNEGQIDLAVFKINDDQFLEFSPGNKDRAKDNFTHVAFSMPKLEEMRTLVEMLGLKPPPLRSGRDHTRNFSIPDSEGHRVEFIRYEPDSLQALARGKFNGREKLSSHLSSLGLPCKDAARAVAFYNKLGFVQPVPGVLAPAGIPFDTLRLLPATQRTELYFDIGIADEGERIFTDPDGVPIHLVRR